MSVSDPRNKDGNNDQHIYHHNDSDGLRLNVSVEKNTKGFNYSATIVGAKTVEEAMTAVQQVMARLKEVYGAASISEENAKVP